MSCVILLPKLSIQAANGLTSPYSVGVPPMTSWLGMADALRRKLSDKGIDIAFNGVVVAYHKHTLHTHREKGDYQASIKKVGVPMIRDSKGKLINAPFIDDVRIDLTISIGIKVDNLPDIGHDELAAEISNTVATLRFAGGDLIGIPYAEIINTLDDEGEQYFLKRLMPGYVMIDRSDLMISEMEKGLDAGDALLELLKATSRSSIDKKQKTTWKTSRKYKGWIVPMTVGFAGISPVISANNQRDEKATHKFAEAVVTACEFIMPFRAETFDSVFWRTHYDKHNELYLTTNNINHKEL